MNRKIIIISSIIFVAVVILAGIYWYYSVKPAEERPGIISGLFPVGEEGELELTVPPEGAAIPPAPEVKILELTQLTKNAVTGAASASTTIKYIEKSTGHIYEIEPTGQNRRRLSNTTILKTFESFWSFNANKIILRYFETDKLYPSVKTFSLSLPLQGATTSAISGIFFPQLVTAVAVSPEEEKVFYLDSTGDGVQGIVADFENKKQVKIFNMQFSSLSAYWPSKNIITLITKPSVVADGFFYSLNYKTGELKRILGGIKGLTALMSPRAEDVVYSQSTGKGLETKNINLKSRKVDDFGITTLPEKCVWSKNNSVLIYCAAPESLPLAGYPDDWYQGLFFFNDSIWQNNISSKETIILKNDTGMDIINLFLTKDENYLIFTNKSDDTLWSLRLK